MERRFPCRLLGGLLALCMATPATAAPDLWDEFCASAEMRAADNAAVESAARDLTRSELHYQRLLHRAEPWLWEILQQVRTRGMPVEIAVLPAIESGFRSRVASSQAAVGLWQIVPATAHRFGLRTGGAMDHRADVGYSTRAALDYLEYLQERFVHWPMVLAAYNAGEGRVRRALAAVGSRPGAGTTRRELRLPAETQAHFHRLMGFVRATCNPDDYGVQRPALPAQPMIRPVNFNRRVSLAELAPLIGTPTNYLRTLNPALTDGHTAASGPHRVWIPEHRVDHLEHRLARHSDLALLEYGLYRVQRRDTRSHIAVRHGTSTRALREMNALASSSIRAGVELRVPLHGGSPRTDL